MVSIYSLRQVYTFLYTIINGNVVASFTHKKEKFEILWSNKNFFLQTYATLNPHPPPLNAIIRIWLDSVPSSFVRRYYVENSFKDGAGEGGGRI